MGTIGDFDFNDVVLKVVPNTANKAKVYICATGGTYEPDFHYNGPKGDQNFGSLHNFMPKFTNTRDKVITMEPVLVGEVDWPDGYTMPTDASRFYIIVNGQSIGITTQTGVAPKAICVQGNWRWPRESVSIVSAYTTLSDWALNINDADARDWYNHPVEEAVISFK